MNTNKRTEQGSVWVRCFSLVIAGMMVMPAGAMAQAQDAPDVLYEPAAATFSEEELDAILAPVALYPDSLLAQIFIASTYPLEVVQADRWVREHEELTGDDLAIALEEQIWDPSVKSLVNFPQVLRMMSEKLDWTQKLGDAFIAQQEDVMSSVQTLRRKADEQGNLKSTEEQKVIVERETRTILIEPADPEVVYVPVYNPTVVYGTWWYPAYPPYYYYPPYYPPGYSYTYFWTGVTVGVAWGYAWGYFNWHRHHVHVNVHHRHHHNRHIKIEHYRDYYRRKGYIGSDGRGRWQHDVSHRRGVAYRDARTAQKYQRGTSNQAARAREAYRGRAEQGRRELRREDMKRSEGRRDVERRGTKEYRERKEGGGFESRPTRERRGTGGVSTRERRGTGGVSTREPRVRERTEQRGGEQVRSRQTYERKERDSAFGGIDRGNVTRGYSERGRESRGGGGISRGGSGGSRGGRVGSGGGRR